MIVLKKTLCVAIFILCTPIMAVGGTYILVRAAFDIGATIVKDVADWLTEDL